MSAIQEKRVVVEKNDAGARVSPAGTGIIIIVCHTALSINRNIHLSLSTFFPVKKRVLAKIVSGTEPVGKSFDPVGFIFFAKSFPAIIVMTPHKQRAPVIVDFLNSC